MIAHGLYSFKLLGRPRLKVRFSHGEVGVVIEDSGDPRDVNSLGIWTEREHEAAILRATAAWNAIMEEGDDV
jgi:hypothetical protein